MHTMPTGATNFAFTFAFRLRYSLLVYLPVPWIPYERKFVGVSPLCWRYQVALSMSASTPRQEKTVHRRIQPKTHRSHRLAGQTSTQKIRVNQDSEQTATKIAAANGRLTPNRERRSSSGAHAAAAVTDI